MSDQADLIGRYTMTPKGGLLAEVTAISEDGRAELTIYRPGRHPFGASVDLGKIQILSPQELQQCEQCQGQGRVIDTEPCRACGGAGVVRDEEA